MANKAEQHFHPDWGGDVDHVAAREAAMRLDALNSTHPVVQHVRTVEQANQAFDSITYSKGESVLSMLEGYAGADVWRSGIQAYVAKHAYQNTQTDDLWAAVEGAGAKGLGTVAREFTNQPGIPLISVGPAQCKNGATTVSLRQGQFSADRRAEVAAKPLSWHVPVRASTGTGEPVRVVAQGAATALTVPGCGPLLINAGQTGYYRTLYQPRQAAALVSAYAGLGAVDQYGLLTDSMALSETGYQPMAIGLDFLAAVPATGNAKVLDEALDQWSGLYDDMEGNEAVRSAIAARALALYAPRLQKLGFTPVDGEAPTDTLLRPNLIYTLGKFGDPTVAAEARRLFAAWQQNPDAIPGSLKSTWLAIAARNADTATWDAIHAKAKVANGSVERTTLYQLLGRAKDEALARRALDLALTDEPGQTTSAGIITAVAGNHPRMAIDFVLAHLSQVNTLVDISGRSRFMQRLAGGNSDPALIAVLENYAKANLAATDRKPIQQAVDRIRYQSEQAPRIKAELAAWLAAHPA